MIQRYPEHFYAFEIPRSLGQAQRKGGEPLIRSWLLWYNSTSILWHNGHVYGTITAASREALQTVNTFSWRFFPVDLQETSLKRHRVSSRRMRTSWKGIKPPGTIPIRGATPIFITVCALSTAKGMSLIMHMLHHISWRGIIKVQRVNTQNVIELRKE